MPTENRRAAVYLPEEIDECLKVFKVENGIKGDSQALIAILSDYFGLTPKMERGGVHSPFVTEEQVEFLKTEVSDLVDSVKKLQTLFSAINRASDRMRRMEARLEALERKTIA